MSEPLYQVCQIIAEKLRDNPQADSASLLGHLQAVLAADPQLKAAVDSRMVQIAQDKATAFQTLVEGGIANIGNHYHVDVKTLIEVLEKLFRERQPRSIPNKYSPQRRS